MTLIADSNLSAPVDRGSNCWLRSSTLNLKNTHVINVSDLIADGYIWTHKWSRSYYHDATSLVISNWNSVHIGSLEAKRRLLWSFLRVPPTCYGRVGQDISTVFPTVVAVINFLKEDVCVWYDSKPARKCSHEIQRHWRFPFQLEYTRYSPAEVINTVGSIAHTSRLGITMRAKQT
jgi:hypothetical protein